MPLLQLHAPPRAGLRRPRRARARRDRRVALPHLPRDLRRAVAARAAERRLADQVGEREQRQQQHPEDDRAPDQARRRCAGGRAAAARPASSLRRRPSPGGAPASKVLARSGVRPGAEPPPSRTPTAPAAAARMTPSLSCFHSAASRRQQLTASSKLPTTAKPDAVRRAGTWSSSWNRRSDSSHQPLVDGDRRRCRCGTTSSGWRTRPCR